MRTPRPILPSTLMHRCFGRERGWSQLVYGWGHDDGGFARCGWWAIYAEGPRQYLGADHFVVMRKFANTRHRNNG